MFPIGSKIKCIDHDGIAMRNPPQIFKDAVVVMDQYDERANKLKFVGCNDWFECRRFRQTEVPTPFEVGDVVNINDLEGIDLMEFVANTPYIIREIREKAVPVAPHKTHLVFLNTMDGKIMHGIYSYRVALAKPRRKPLIAPLGTTVYVTARYSQNIHLWDNAGVMYDSAKRGLRGIIVDKIGAGEELAYEVKFPTLEAEGAPRSVYYYHPLCLEKTRAAGDKRGGPFDIEEIEEVKAYVRPAPPPPPPPPKPEDKRDAIMADLLKRSKGHTGTSSFAWVTKGAVGKVTIDSVCHAAVHRGYMDDPIVYLFDSLQNSKGLVQEEYQGFYRRYITWVMNDSPWKHVFLTKDAEKAIAEGVEYDTNQSVHHIMAGIIALREGTEFRQKLGLWNELVEKGYSFETAYVLTLSFRHDPERNVYLRFAGNSNHNTLHSTMVLKDACEFMVKGYGALAPHGEDKMNEGGSRDRARVNSAIARCGVYGDADPNGSIGTFTGNVKEVKHGEGWNVWTSVQEQSLFEYADHIETLIKELK